MQGKIAILIMMSMLLGCAKQLQRNDDDFTNKRDSTTAILLLFVYGTVLAGVVIRYIIEILHIPIPFQVFILIIGVIIGYLGEVFKVFDNNFFTAIGGKNEYLLIIALPVLIFKLCLCMEVHSFMRCILQVMIISIPCTLINGFIVGFIMRLVENSAEWSFDLGIMYGFTCVSIYPQETLMYLRELGAKGKHLSDLLEGEAVFGTAVCIIMIIAALKHCIGILDTVEQYSLFIFHYVLGGILLGSISGFFLGRLMKLFYNDAINIMIVSISAPFMVYYIGIYVFRVCGIVALIMVGFMMSFQRAELPLEIDASLVYFWELVSLIINSVVFALNGVVFGLEVVEYIEASDIAKIGIAYMVVYFSRFATFIVFSTVMSRIEYGISFRHMILAAWGGVRGAVTLCLVMISYQEKDSLRNYKHTVLIHTIGVVFLSLLINVPTVPSLLNCLGISYLSKARQHNMNNCVHYVMTKRDRVIALLKMDRFLADANWTLVNSSTSIRHPYHQHRDADADHDYSMGLRGSICPDCHKEVANQPTHREIEEMRREARMRVLKAKKISYARQYENGMLSKEAIAALTHAVEVAQNNEDNYLKIDNLLNLFTKKFLLQQVRNHTVKYFHSKITSHSPKPPRKPSRRTCFNVVNHSGYSAANYLIILCNVASCIFELTLTNYETEKLQMYIMKGLNSTFLLYFLIDMLIKIYAFSYLYIWHHGVKNYLRDPWHVFDVLLLIVAVVDVTIDVLDFYGIFLKYRSIENKFIIFVKLIRALRLLRLITLCRIFYPILIRFCDMKIDSRMSTVYDIGKGFVKGEEEVLEMLDQMIPNKDVRQEMRQRMENDKLLVTKELGLIQKEKPWIAITVKTKQAIRTILNNMETAIDDLRSSGWIDHIEYKKLIESLNEKKKQVKRMKMINSSPPKIIFQEIIWMGEETQIIDFLFSRITTKIYDPGDIICFDGEKPAGIFIIITGLFKSTYRPVKKVLDALQDYGVLPVIDYISSIRFDRTIEEYIVSGNCVGELSFLTGRPYNATLIADTPSQVYILPTDLLQEASKLSPDIVNGFEARMWKYISLRLAVSILLKTPAYSTSTQEKIRYALERCFVPNLENFKIFINNTMIEDIILIEGVLIDSNTKENYTAPCYIPRTVQKLTLVRNSVGELGLTVATKILIIPTKDVEPEDIMEAEEEIAEFYLKTNIVQQDYSRIKPSKIYKRKRRGSCSYAGSAKSGKLDISETISYSKSTLFSIKSRATTNEFEVPEFRRREILLSSSYDNTLSSTSDPTHWRTTHLRQYAEENASFPKEESDKSISAEGTPSKAGKRLVLQPVNPAIINILSEEEIGSRKVEGVRRSENDSSLIEEKENTDSSLDHPHPFSIEEELSSGKKSKDIDVTGRFSLAECPQDGVAPHGLPSITCLDLFSTENDFIRLERKAVGTDESIIRTKPIE